MTLSAAITQQKLIYSTEPVARMILGKLVKRNPEPSPSCKSVEIGLVQETKAYFKIEHSKRQKERRLCETTA